MAVHPPVAEKAALALLGAGGGLGWGGEREDGWAVAATAVLDKGEARDEREAAVELMVGAVAPWAARSRVLGYDVETRSQVLGLDAGGQSLSAELGYDVVSRCLLVVLGHDVVARGLVVALGRGVEPRAGGCSGSGPGCCDSHIWVVDIDLFGCWADPGLVVEGGELEEPPRHDLGFRPVFLGGVP